MLAGRSLPHAVIMILPEAYRDRGDLPDYLTRIVLEPQAESNSCAALWNDFGVSRTDISLILSAFSALTILLGPTAAVVLIAFLAGVLVGSRHKKA